MAKALHLIHGAAFSRPARLELLISSRHEDDHMLDELETEIDNESRPDAQFQERETVQADTLDSMIQKRGLPWPDVIVVTVNGAEMEVLKGSRRILRNMSRGARLLVKAHARKADGEPIFEDVKSLLLQEGFRVSRTRRSPSVSQDHSWKIREGDVFARKA